jgi:hypothetical protein
MYLTKEIKEEIFAKHGEKNKLENPKLKLLCSLTDYLFEHLKKIVMIITQSAH